MSKLTKPKCGKNHFLSVDGGKKEYVAMFHLFRMDPVKINRSHAYRNNNILNTIGRFIKNGFKWSPIKKTVKKGDSGCTEKKTLPEIYHQKAINHFKYENNNICQNTQRNKNSLNETKITNN